MAAKTMDDIALLMKQLKFKKKLFGGVKEMDVWRKLEVLHQQYQSVYAVQEALHQHQMAEKDARIAQLEAQLAGEET
jgi:hypothetical protein